MFYAYNDTFDKYHNTKMSEKQVKEWVANQNKMKGGRWVIHDETQYKLYHKQKEELKKHTAASFFASAEKIGAIVKVYTNEKNYVDSMVRELRLRGYQIQFDPHKIGGDLDIAHGT